MTTRSLDGCIKCGACVRVCPVLVQEGKEIFPGPRRLAVEGPRFNQELLALRLPLELCTTCGRCSSLCPSSLPLPEAMVRVRSLLSTPVDRPEGHARMQANIDESLRTVPSPLPSPPVPSAGNLMFFPGCIGDGRTPDSITASLALLRAVGDSPFVPPGWACCGSPLEKIGDTRRWEMVRAHNEKLFRGIDTMVTSCPGCTVQLRKGYGKDAWHIIEHLHASGRTSAKIFDPRLPKVKVALHQPCHLARSVGPHTMDMARDLLALVPGVELVDTGTEADCCGGGGGLASAHPDVAARMARRRVEKALGEGAEVLVAPCPFCVLNLGKFGLMRVQDFTAFLADRLL